MSRLVALLSTGQTQVLAAVNAILGLLIVFHLVFTQVQLGAVDVCVNAVLAVLAQLFLPTKAASPPAAK